MSKKADDAGGLSPTKEENAFGRNLGQKEGSILIKNQYKGIVSNHKDKELDEKGIRIYNGNGD